MMRLAALVFLLAFSGRSAVFAQDLPALHDVVGVAEGDALNIRERPDATSFILGTLAPDATGVEVLATSGDWALIGWGEGTGYVALRYLARQDGPPWTALTTPLTCSGTEPFWSLKLDPAGGTAALAFPDSPVPLVRSIDKVWPGEPWSPMAAVAMASDIAVLRAAECSDGMSDRAYGIAADLFLSGAEWSRLSGCCTLAQP
jgi:uncharacterized membrane protein